MIYKVFERGNILGAYKEEVLRYLGYKNQKIQQSLNDLIDECIKEVQGYIKPKYIFEIYDIKKSKDKIELISSILTFRGKDIINHLKDSKKCVVMAVTLGNDIDTKIRYYEKFNLTKALILDACATSAVENLCDKVQEDIKNKAKSINMGITFRYSPGYGDFSIDIQKDIISSLEANKKIGLSSTENYILIPRKSVTAVIGFQEESIKSKPVTCELCNKYDSCEYKKGGRSCENS